jgi:hypothetical protein
MALRQRRPRYYTVRQGPVCKGKKQMCLFKEFVDDLYVHEILDYKLGKIYTVSNNRISIITI